MLKKLIMLQSGRKGIRNEVKKKETFFVLLHKFDSFGAQ